MHNKVLIALILPLALAACADERLAPAPGEHPDWPQPSAPRPSYAPLPFTTNYAPYNGKVLVSPPAKADGTVPYAVRGAEAAPAPAASGDMACHPVPPATFEGRVTTMVCQQPDGSWVYVAQ